MTVYTYTEQSQSVQNAGSCSVVTEVGGVSADGVAGHEERSTADAPVGQTPEQLVRPVVGRVFLGGTTSRRCWGCRLRLRCSLLVAASRLFACRCRLHPSSNNSKFTRHSSPRQPCMHITQFWAASDTVHIA